MRAAPIAHAPIVRPDCLASQPGIIYTESLAEAREQASLGLKEAKMPNVVGAPLTVIFGASPVQWAAQQVGPIGDLFAPPSCVADVAAAAIAHVVDK